MKSFDDICRIFKHICANPAEIVDYLTVGDFLQMRQHIQICESCDKIADEVVANDPKSNKPQGDVREN